MKTVWLYDLRSPGVVACWPTGLLFGNQVGGTACDQQAVEGFFVPLALPSDVFRRYQNTLHMIELREVDKVLEDARAGWVICHDRLVDGEALEAWVPVVRRGPEHEFTWEDFPPFMHGWLTWENSD